MNKGEIWTDDAGRYFLILANNERFSTVLNLKEENRDDEDVKVIAHGVMYTNPAMISYKFNNQLCEFVRILKNAEFNAVMNGVAEKLGFANVDTAYEEAAIETVNKLKAEKAELQMKLEGAEREMEAAKHMADKLSFDLKEANMKLKTPAPTDPGEMIRLETERDLYKRLYEQAIERMLGR